MHDYNERERERQEVVLESMTVLVAKPVQKEAVLQVNLHHGDRHRNQLHPASSDRTLNLMASVFAALVSGLLFGLGLTVSQNDQPGKGHRLH